MNNLLLLLFCFVAKWELFRHHFAVSFLHFFFSTSEFILDFTFSEILSEGLQLLCGLHPHLCSHSITNGSIPPLPTCEYFAGCSMRRDAQTSPPQPAGDSAAFMLTAQKHFRQLAGSLTLKKAAKKAGIAS